MDLEKEVIEIQARNKRVEMDKAWETSFFRKLSILLLTYLVVVLTMFVLGIDNFFVNALIPSLGFFLSTLTLPFLKKSWLKKHFKN